MPEFALDYERPPRGLPVPPQIAVGVPMDLPAGREICAGISLKRAGDMGRSAEDPGLFSPRRAAFLRAAGLAGRRVFASRQVHSQEVLVVGEGSPDEVNRVEADGLLTDRPDALLTVTVADCLPIFLVDPERGALGLLHSGWQGTGIVERAVRLLASTYGSDPAALRVTIGPGIGGCCYRVDAERAALFRRRFGDGAVRAHDDGPHLDLRAANLALLERLGVSHVTVVRDCTACSPPLASYRRDGAAFVRMLAFIGAAGAGRTGRSRR